MADSSNETMSRPGPRSDVGEPVIAVVGAGRMGTGIALSFAYAGHRVGLFDSEDRSSEAFGELAERVHQDVQKELRPLSKLQILTEQQAQTIAERITVIAKSEAANKLTEADFIFEAVAEILEIKQSTYEWLNTCVSNDAIIGSTTSTILVDTLAEFVDNSSCFLDTHWLNPALLMPLVEISPGSNTSEAALSAMKALLESIGKETVICAASPGFIVPRIQALAMTEAARLVEEGVASAEDIDKAIRVGFGVRYAVLGLLEFIDWGGGDIVYHATNYLADAVDDKRFSTPDIIKKNMQENRTGLRDGVGFYDYHDKDIDAYREQRMGEFVKLLKHLALLPDAK